MTDQRNASHLSWEALAAERRFVLQLELVREHWGAVRHLWLGDSDLDPASYIRSELSDTVFLGCGLPGTGTIKPTRDGRFQFAEDGCPAVIIAAYDTIPGLLGTN